MIESLQKLEERALTFPEMAASIIVYNQETLRAANNFLLGVKGVMKEVTDAFGPMKKKTNEAHKAVVAQEKKYLEPLLQAEKSAKMQIGVYVRKRQEIRAEAERKAAEAERVKLQKQADIEAEAQRFENHGYREEAKEIRAKQPDHETVIVPDAPSLNGVQIRKNLTFEITDMSKVPDRFKSIDMKKIRAYIREHKEKAIEHDIPGIRIYYEDSVAASSGD